MSRNNFSKKNPREKSSRGKTIVRINKTLAGTAAVIKFSTSCCQKNKGLIQQQTVTIADALHNRQGTLNDVIVYAALENHDVDCQVTYLDLIEILEKTETSLTLTELIADLATESIDAEHLTWRIIGKESENHMGLIHNEINKLISHLPPTDPADLIGYGWRGLRMALRQYNPDLGYTLSTFACPKINGAIRDGVRSEHHLPKRLTTFARKIEAKNQELTVKLSRKPTWDEIANDLDLAAKERSYLPHIGTPASLDEICTNLEQDTPKFLVEKGNSIEHLVEQSSKKTEIQAALSGLPEEQNILLSSLYFENKSLSAAAKKAKIPQKNINETLEEALNSLRESLAAWA